MPSLISKSSVIEISTTCDAIVQLKYLPVTCEYRIHELREWRMALPSDCAARLPISYKYGSYLRPSHPAPPRSSTTLNHFTYRTGLRNNEHTPLLRRGNGEKLLPCAPNVTELCAGPELGAFLPLGALEALHSDIDIDISIDIIGDSDSGRCYARPGFALSIQTTSHRARLSYSAESFTSLGVEAPGRVQFSPAALLRVAHLGWNWMAGMRPANEM
ncbi:hypothetical protein EVAR_38275_1 [Eumeta japonica]|uniref:Uncharacterized protein n=1 Tax=Eumeta variegata TaxID=151549 RepID=A0A4C1WAK0_EUMVA|nr:hypothetical protein EVAR_38275_1 [Eumeta japonica]